MADGQWPPEWMRGVLEVCVLHVVHRGPTYGYAIAQSLEDAGLGSVKGGTLYPLLTRLEQAGLVEVEWRPSVTGPGRKYYTLTDAGRAEATRRANDWLAFCAVTRDALASPDRPVPDRPHREAHER